MGNRFYCSRGVISTLRRNRTGDLQFARRTLYQLLKVEDESDRWTFGRAFSIDNYFYRIKETVLFHGFVNLMRLSFKKRVLRGPSLYFAKTVLVRGGFVNFKRFFQF